MTGLRTALRELPDAAFLDLLESDDAYRFVLDVPGATAETVELGASTGRLSVEARRADRPGGEYDVVESGRLYPLDVDLPLPPDATAEGASATVERGVLEVTIPKRGSVDATEIEVEGA